MSTMRLFLSLVILITTSPQPVPFLQKVAVSVASAASYMRTLISPKRLLNQLIKLQLPLGKNIKSTGLLLSYQKIHKCPSRTEAIEASQKWVRNLHFCCYLGQFFIDFQNSFFL